MLVVRANLDFRLIDRLTLSQSTEIPCKSLGMKVEVYDPSGKNIEHLREAGEMVCTRPHPSIPLYFWGDSTGAKFRTTYFNTYPGNHAFLLAGLS